MKDNNDSIDKKVKSDIEYKDIKGRLLHIKIGDADSPATSDDILDLQGRIEEILEKNSVDCLALVTHHAVQIDIVESPYKEKKESFYENE